MAFPSLRALSSSVAQAGRARVRDLMLSPWRWARIHLGFNLYKCVPAPFAIVQGGKQKQCAFSAHPFFRQLHTWYNTRSCVTTITMTTSSQAWFVACCSQTPLLRNGAGSISLFMVWPRSSRSFLSVFLFGFSAGDHTRMPPWI